MKKRNLILLSALIFLSLGWLIGYGMGLKTGISWAVKIGLNFVEIDVDEDMLADAMFRYKNQIGQFYNAPICNDTRTEE